MLIDHSIRKNSSLEAKSVKKLLKKYQIKSIEDPFGEDDWKAWSKFVKQTNNKTQIIGDDLFVTNIKRLKTGIEKNAGNAILVKF